MRSPHMSFLNHVKQRSIPTSHLNCYNIPADYKASLLFGLGNCVISGYDKHSYSLTMNAVYPSHNMEPCRVGTAIDRCQNGDFDMLAQGNEQSEDTRKLQQGVSTIVQIGNYSKTEGENTSANLNNGETTVTDHHDECIIHREDANRPICPTSSDQISISPDSGNETDQAADSRDNDTPLHTFLSEANYKDMQSGQKHTSNSDVGRAVENSESTNNKPIVHGQGQVLPSAQPNSCVANDSYCNNCPTLQEASVDTSNVEAGAEEQATTCLHLASWSETKTTKRSDAGTLEVAQHAIGYNIQVSSRDPASFSLSTSELEQGNCDIVIDRPKEVVIHDQEEVKNSSCVQLGNNNVCSSGGTEECTSSALVPSSGAIARHPRFIIREPESVVVYSKKGIDNCENVQIGNNNLMDLERKVLPQNEGIMEICFKAGINPRKKEDIRAKLQDPGIQDRLATLIAERCSVDCTVESVEEGCILLKIKVATEADRLQLIRKARDGTLQQILIETFLPEFAEKGIDVPINLAIGVRNPSQEMVHELEQAVASSRDENVVVIKIRGGAATDEQAQLHQGQIGSPKQSDEKAVSVEGQEDVQMEDFGGPSSAQIAAARVDGTSASTTSQQPRPIKDLPVAHLDSMSVSAGDVGGGCEKTGEQEARLHHGHPEKIKEQDSIVKSKSVSPRKSGIQRAKTKLTCVVKEFCVLDKILATGFNLDVVERGYGQILINAISSEDEVLECEALKSLGDLYLQKAKMNNHKAKSFNKACGLYTEVLQCCSSRQENEAIEHRIKYAEKCTKLVYCQSTMESDDEILDVSTELCELERKTWLKGYGLAPLIEAYTKYFVTAVVSRKRSQKVESLKSLGDLYLERGQVGEDETAFTKAGGLYRAALRCCEDSDGRETLEHRIKYAEKIKQAGVKKRQDRRLSRNWRVTSTFRSYPITSQATSDVIDQTNRQGMEVALTNTSYTELLQEGCWALKTGDLDRAELVFAAALKAIHMKDPNIDQYKKEAEILCKLSDVYLERGIQSEDGGDFTKAAALCNSALVRAMTEDRAGIKQAILRTSQMFVEHVLGIKQAVAIGDTEKHKLTLTESRRQVEDEMNRIELEINPYKLDDNDPKIREVEKERGKAIMTLFQTIAQQRKMFLAGLVDECVEVMGPPPCKYALIGLGSLATGLVTPYSDLEFAILIEEETEGNIKYFRNLTHYLHLKVIDLGETILPAMGIKSLNDFYSNDPLDNWFYDSVTPHGFAFDGAMPNACKTPLVRGITIELIHTPRMMTKIIEDDLTLHSKKGYSLASILGNVCLITGEQDLVDAYFTLWTREMYELQACHILAEGTNLVMFKRTSHPLDAKKEIYLFPTLAVSCWALLCGIQPTTIWETIQKMHMKGVINTENTHHLMVMVSISAEVKLRTFMNNRGQTENMPALFSMDADTDIGEKLNELFYYSTTKQLMRYYNTATPLKGFISQITKIKPPAIGPSILFDNSSTLQAEVYTRLCDYEKAKTCITWSLWDDGSKLGREKEHINLANSLINLGTIWWNLGDYRKAISCYEKSLQMKRENTVDPVIATLLNNLGVIWSELGDVKMAVNYFEQSLQMKWSICGKHATHPDIAKSLNNLGTTWSSLGDHIQAAVYYEQSLRMMQSIYGKNTANADIATSLYNLGDTWWCLRDYRRAINYQEQSLQMERAIYGENTAHPRIAMSLTNLGTTWSSLCDYRKAVSYHELSLQMKRNIYGENTAHPDIAMSLTILGTTWRRLGDVGKAVYYFEKAISFDPYWSQQMMQSIYGEDTAHPDIAMSLTNLGTTWSSLGDHRKAISYHELSLQMKRNIYGDNTAHPDIVNVLIILGNACSQLGDHRKAISCYEQSLQIGQSIYGKNTAHPDIAKALENLVITCSHIGEHRKAIAYREQFLKMMQSMYGKFKNLGNASSHLGDQRKDVISYEELLQISQSIYGESTAHLDMSLTNLDHLE
ncbi:uncharacterized protein LOC118426748 [Branchiostoma floridae]|uniref:Uncharacterized protein LOC118426748 n=1 Tax=Branchiostoma floridae TaxID=7739 RepID=A0A9J7N6W1_BRAFL|nr:uncharacterized protein LOC118426748 [Branchiostoma floridae]XP_035692195.1 uncharacterized protein LOC118426748 [Branchiostoma floridae]